MSEHFCDHILGIEGVEYILCDKPARFQTSNHWYCADHWDDYEKIMAHVGGKTYLDMVREP